MSDKKKIVPRKAILTHVRIDNSQLDTCILIVYPEPASYTGEDVVEFHLHGNPILLDLLIRAIVDCGARIAEPGEFTKRAFLNGKMDLAQAESVAELIQARSLRQIELLQHNIDGHLKEKIRSIGEMVVDLLATVEAELDFFEGDASLDRREFLAAINNIRVEIDRLRRVYREQRYLRDGLKVAIVGRPNVGKSTMMNALLEYERSLVDETAGTTRDFIEASCFIDGHEIILCDTAGIRASEDQVEAKGIARTMEKIATADVVVHLSDFSDLGTLAARKSMLGRTDKIIDVVAKSDLLDPAQIEENNCQESLLFVSGKYRSGLDKLRRAITSLPKAREIDEEDLSINERQGEIIEAMSLKLEEMSAVSKTGLPLDLIAADLHELLDTLSVITGKISSEEILDRIFARFCIGK